MIEEQSYEFCLSAMVVLVQRAIAGGDLAQFVVITLVDHRCFDAPFSRGLYRVSRLHLKTALDFKHCTRERGSCLLFAD